MNYNSIATVYVGKMGTQQCQEADYTLVIATDDEGFSRRFHDWQLEQHLAGRSVLVNVLCTPVTMPVDIETRFTLPGKNPGDDVRHVSANVVSFMGETGNYSRIGIGVFLHNYRFVQR